MNKDNLRSICLLGYSISRCKTTEITAEAFKLSRGNSKRSYMACANPHSIVVASKDREFQSALQNADILIPDGYGIILAAKILGLPLRERIAGSEFFRAFSELAEKNGGLKYFLLGSTEYVLSLMVERLNREFPSIKICGVYAPPFKEVFSEEDNKKMIGIINSAKPDVLWVGMTAPKQEKWIYHNRDRLQVPFIGAIGAVFDFYAGTKQRPSVFWQKLGLEWLPRFLKEPRRLWERSLKSMPIFLLWALREKIKQNKRNQ